MWLVLLYSSPKRCGTLFPLPIPRRTVGGSLSRFSSPFQSRDQHVPSLLRQVPTKPIGACTEHVYDHLPHEYSQNWTFRGNKQKRYEKKDTKINAPGGEPATPPPPLLGVHRAYPRARRCFCPWRVAIYLLDMSFDQISSRGSRISRVGGSNSSSSAWQDGSRGGREGGGMRSEVSRPQSSVVVSGGGTFRSAIASTTRAPASGSGPMRRQGVARGARETAAPYQRPTRGAESVYDRLGETFELGGKRSLDFRGQFPRADPPLPSVSVWCARGH